MTTTQARTALRRYVRRRDAWRAEEAQLPALARQARDAGLSVAEIGTLLGVGRMHAHRLVHGRSDR